MVVTPFQLQIELRTPMQLGHYLRLDGLLWHTLFLHHLCPYKAVDDLGSYLSIAETGQYYHASAMMFGILGIQPDKSSSGDIYDNLLGLRRAKVGAMHSGSDLSPENFPPNSVNGNRYKTVQTAGGVYKNRLKAHPVYMAHSVVFHGVGDGNEIAELFNFYLTSIGMNANSGFGTIGKVSVEQIEADLSLVDADGLPARPLPIEDFIRMSDKQVLTGEAMLKPPYRDQETVLCALPERVRKTQINARFGA